MDNEYGYRYHGMVCIEKKENSLKFILFGGSNIRLIDSFFEIFISWNDKLKLSDINEINWNENINIKYEWISNLIKKNKKKKKYFEKQLENYGVVKEFTTMDTINDREYGKNENGFYEHFNYHTILNYKNERIIVIIGGLITSESTRSIILYNCNTYQLTMIEDVCLYSIY